MCVSYSCCSVRDKTKYHPEFFYSGHDFQITKDSDGELKEDEVNALRKYLSQTKMKEMKDLRNVPGRDNISSMILLKFSDALLN